MQHPGLRSVIERFIVQFLVSPAKSLSNRPGALSNRWPDSVRPASLSRRFANRIQYFSAADYAHSRTLPGFDDAFLLSLYASPAKLNRTNKIADGNGR